MKPKDYPVSRYYIAHHFVFYPLMGAAAAFSIWCIFYYRGNGLIWAALAFAFCSLIMLSLMLRQHYALGNQNRIVRLEMRLRYYILTHQRFEVIEQQLSFSQIAALRFASDEELPGLTKRAIAEKMSPGRIRHSIQNFVPDYMRL
jgi:hypothetical protein